MRKAPGKNASPKSPVAADATRKAPAKGARKPLPSVKRMIIRTIVIFSLLLGAFYGVDYATDPELKWYLSRLASVCGKILALLGYNTHSFGTAITSNAFSVQIVRGCDGLEPMAVYLSAIIAFPVSIRTKLLGMAVGVPVLIVINLIRIVSLFIIGIHSPKYFQMAHEEIWQAAFIVLSVAGWTVWAQWALTRRMRSQHG